MGRAWKASLVGICLAAIGAIVWLVQLVGHTDPPVLGPDVVVDGDMGGAHSQDASPSDPPAAPPPEDDGAVPVAPSSPPQAGDDDDNDDDDDFDDDDGDDAGP